MELYNLKPADGSTKKEKESVEVKDQKEEFLLEVIKKFPFRLLKKEWF